MINIFALPCPKGEPSFSLLDHTENVCALHVAEDGTIISGSWDRCVLQASSSASAAAPAHPRAQGRPRSGATSSSSTISSATSSPCGPCSPSMRASS